jgi:subtilase family serine protease
MKLLNIAKLVWLAGAISALGHTLYAQTASPHVVTGAVPPFSTGSSGACAYFSGHGVSCPAQLRQAYMTGFIANSHDGASITVYIVDPYNLPLAVADLGTFSSQTGLPQLDGVGGNGTFTIVSPFGAPATAVGTGWEYQIALDTQWVHAMAPKANIVLVEALSSSSTDMFNALSYAVHASGANIVSGSWGVSEFSGETSVDSTLAGATVPVVFSTGDSGAPGAFPAFSPHVTAVGGTTLNLNSIGYRSSETGWPGSGGGVSSYLATPAFQSNNGVNFGARAIPDVALDADPATGVMITLLEYSQNFGVGGTGVACQIFAGVLANVDAARLFAGKSPLGSSSNIVNPLLYSLYNSALYRYDFFDVISGNNSFSAGPGYDLVTGLGVPSEAALAARLVALL